jgi:hypothetical protein
MDMVDGLPSSTGGVYGISSAFEAAAKEVGDALFVLNHHDSHFIPAYRSWLSGEHGSRIEHRSEPATIVSTT